MKDFHFLLMMSHFMSQYRIPPQMHADIFLKFKKNMYMDSDRILDN